MIDQHWTRRQWLRNTVVPTVIGTLGLNVARRAVGESTVPAAVAPGGAKSAFSKPVVRTVLGPVEPEKLGVVLMHEHAPIVDWSELYETPGADYTPLKKQMLDATAQQLTAFHASLLPGQGPGAIVECTPIRVGRYPRLMVELARQTAVQIIACTGFWCEAFAPQHPWALRLGLEKNGVRKLAELYIREIEQGMEDPRGAWGERFTDVKVGIIKCASSTYLRPSERRCHEAAAVACRETGCPITTHTTDGGGLEQAELFLKAGVSPEKVIIGHQGHLDDRTNAEATELHLRIAGMGCYVQFDRVGHEKYAVDKMARLIQSLISRGFVQRVLVGHDLVPFVYRKFAESEKPQEGWQENHADFTVVTTRWVAELKRQGASDAHLRTILVENPARVLAF